MLKTLRSRLIFSHALPLLLIVPLVGIILLYEIETRVLIPNLTRSLIGDARLIADITSAQPEIWGNPGFAQSLVLRLNPGQPARVMLLTSEGAMVASSEKTDSFSQEISLDDLKALLSGQMVARTQFSLTSRGDVIDVMAPVIDERSRVVGIVRLTYRYNTFYQEFFSLRQLIVAILLVGLLVGIGLGSYLAFNISTPLRQVTHAVSELATGKRSDTLLESGPEEVRQLQRAANHLVERLRFLEETRRKLLANLVHELGRPLGALRAAIQALLRGAKDDPQLLAELLQGMDLEALRLQRLTEDLAELHDQVLGALELDLQPLALADWLSRTLLPWQEAAQVQRISWQVDLAPDLPTIQADANRLGQALGNLVSNAIKFTPPGGMVSIVAGVEQDQVQIRVGDSGAGIAPDEQEKIFTPFYRGSQGRRFPQGMGLGLSIARDLVQAHGGRIELSSTPGKGSIFTLWLPK